MNKICCSHRGADGTATAGIFDFEQATEFVKGDAGMFGLARGRTGA